MNTPTTFADRLNEALAASSKSRSQLAGQLRGPEGKIGISAAAVGQQLSGQTKQMTAENAARAARFLGVDFYWLCTGEGRMRPSAADHRSAHRVAERENPYGATTSLDAALDLIARALAAAPVDSREALAANFEGWARAGGQGPWRHVVQTLLTGSHGKRQGAG